MQDRTGFLASCARDYGDIVPLRFGPKRAVLISNPDDVEDVLVARHHQFVKPYALRLKRVAFDNGRQGDEGDFWRRQMAPAFSRHHLASYGQVMVGFTERRLATWRDGETRDLHADLMALTLEIIAKSLFAADVTDESGAVGAALGELMEAFFARMRTMFLVPEGLPTPGNRRRQQAARRLDRFIDGIIAQRRAAADDGDDLLSLLLRVEQTVDGRPVTDLDLRDEVMTLFLAGHETTALALTWACFLLARHPEVETKLVAELAEVLGGRPPTVADRPRLVYTERVIMEAMRLYPPLWAMGRLAVADCEIGGYRVPAGTVVLMSQWVMHRDERSFPRPETFDPDRWADGLAKRLPRYAYFPFGGGPRVCIGSAFAMLETVLVLATLYQRFHLGLADGQPVVPFPSITLHPERGVRVVLQTRAADVPRIVDAEPAGVGV